MEQIKGEIKEKIKEEIEQITFKEKVVYINRVGKVAKGEEEWQE